MKLNIKEIQSVSSYITNNKNIGKLKLIQIINNCYIKDKNNLLQFINDFKKNEQHLLKKYLNRFQIENIANKTFKHPALLAFQYLGNPQILKKPIVAIIGTRKPTYYGRVQTEIFTRTLAKAGCTILSGGAIGIDAIANTVGHEYGSSCAILGSGIQKFYPISNINLFQKLGNSENGLILSEFHSLMPPQKWNFPRRNISIAALADFVLVIEADLTSGSLITANAACDLGTDVGAIPGDVNSTNSKGTNELIKNGAFCIQTPQDVLDRIQNNHHLF